MAGAYDRWLVMIGKLASLEGSHKSHLIHYWKSIFIENVFLEFNFINRKLKAPIEGLDRNLPGISTEWICRLLGTSHYLLNRKLWLNNQPRDEFEVDVSDRLFEFSQAESRAPHCHIQPVLNQHNHIQPPIHSKGSHPLPHENITDLLGKADV